METGGKKRVYTFKMPHSEATGTRGSSLCQSQGWERVMPFLGGSRTLENLERV